MNPKLTAWLLILAAVLANVGFTALGSIFNYPDVLDEPAGDVLASFRDHEGAVSAWFSVLALSAALLRARSRSASGASRRRGPCASRCGSGSPRPPSRSSACCAGRSSSRATRPTRRAATAPSPPPPATRSRTAERHPRHGHRRDARLSPHRHVDGARHRRARAPLRRALVQRARRRLRGARPRRRALAAGPARGRHRELLRLRPLEPLADRLRRRDPACASGASPPRRRPRAGRR